MSFPVRDVHLPRALSGQANGKLDPAILVETPGLGGGPTVTLVGVAARSWRAMTAHALRDGVVLRATSEADTYRPYTVQERIFRQRYTTTVLPGRPSRSWLGKRWYQRPGTAMAAVPGTSNHGRAIAVDDDLDADPHALTWLIEHADEYGWSWEVQSEDWHLRYYAGDSIPAAVLAYEKQATPTTTGDDDVDPVCVPSWGKRQGDGRLPFFRLIRGTEGAAPFTAKVLAYPGAPLSADAGKVPGWKLGDSFGIPTLFMAGLSARALAIEEGPGGAVVVVAEDGATFDVAKRPT